MDRFRIVPFSDCICIKSFGSCLHSALWAAQSSHLVFGVPEVLNNDFRFYATAQSQFICLFIHDFLLSVITPYCHESHYSESEEDTDYLHDHIITSRLFLKIHVQSACLDAGIVLILLGRVGNEVAEERMVVDLSDFDVWVDTDGFDTGDFQGPVA